MQSRREFLKTGAAFGAAGLAGSHLVAARRPNVVMIITDDQGYGDLSIHGNNNLETPNLDRIGREGVQFTQFHVQPVCSPTRSCLMTGRYNYRTGVVDTYAGRSLMYPDETTLGELFSRTGYRTGIFGKWHLGDNYPMRAMDQGFQETLVHKGGGLAQPSDVPDGGYFDPVLLHNGKAAKHTGYCTDIFTTAAMNFIGANRNRPFFTWLATNAPHVPLQVDDRYAEPFRKRGLDENLARVYGMVRNLDENVGRLLAHLRTLGIERETLVIFMTDNGPQGRRYNAGMRGTKGTVYEGGIRVPFFVRMPGTLEAGRAVDRLAAHIDLLPTLLDACGLPQPDGLKLDGRSLWPLATGRPGGWPDRTLVFQWHRGNQPQPFRNSAVRTQRYKLVDGKELYDVAADPAESTDLAAQHPEIVTQLRAEYERWFDDVSSTRGYDPPPIVAGTPHENPTVLTRQDWRDAENWNDEHQAGHWIVELAASGLYDVAVTIFPPDAAGEVRVRWNGIELKGPIGARTVLFRFAAVKLRKGRGKFEVFAECGGQTYGARYVEIRRL